MILNTRFWKNWPTLSKALFFVFSGFCLFLSALLLFWHFNGYDNVLSWDVATELLKKDIAVEAFVEKGLRFTNNEIVYYVKEWFIPSAQHISDFPVLLLLFCSSVGLALMSSALSSENTLWLLPAIILTALFLLTGRMEIILGQTESLAFLVSFAIIGGFLFLFNSFIKAASFWLRFVVILVSLIILFLCLNAASVVDEPLLAFAQYGLIFPLAVFATFVFMVGHEAIAIIVYAASSGTEKGKNSLGTYLMLSVFYLLNCLLIYLENGKYIEASSYIISPVWLFIFSTVAGLWGFRKQSEELGWFSFQKTGVWLYLGAALVSTAILGFAFSTGNDPLFELLIDYTAICHLILGLAFFIHVIINFIALFRQGLNVHLVLYKPKFNRLILTKVAAVAAVAFLLIQKNIYSYSQLKAGLANAIGDYYQAEGELTAAETFYKESVMNDLYNHKANYALAQMAYQVGDQVTASYYYKRALQKNPTEYTYAALSQNLEAEDLYFESLFNLREGLKAYPKSARLMTNMAHTLEKANARDSVYIYLNKALALCSDCALQNTNLQAFWIENALPAKLDSVTRAFKDEGESNLANQLAIARMTGNIPVNLPEVYEGVSPNSAQFASFYNRAMLPSEIIQKPDSVWSSLVENSVGAGLNNDVLLAKAYQSYKSNEKISALKQMTYLAQDSSETGMRNRRTLGLWYLKEGLYQRAVNNLEASGDESSVEVLEENNFRSHLLSSQLQQAGELHQLELSMETYQDILKKAPLNGFLVKDIASFLEEKGELNQAYQVVFDALEFNESSVVLWQKYVLLAVKNGVNDYAINGLDKLEALLPDDEFAKFYEQYEQAKKDFEAGFEPL
ncbi:hypothetical protein [Jiulongibacter sp. NS-SX5]|uniref:hypothetical protein n=1 Tax=Jiulongibacter sp. NS-SX5 TaxID=3463854 RepID=UPI004058CF38